VTSWSCDELTGSQIFPSLHQGRKAVCRGPSVTAETLNNTTQEFKGDKPQNEVYEETKGAVSRDKVVFYIA